MYVWPLGEQTRRAWFGQMLGVRQHRQLRDGAEPLAAVHPVSVERPTKETNMVTAELVGGMTDAEWAARREELDTSFTDRSAHGPARALHAWLMIHPEECERVNSAYTYMAKTGRGTIWEQLATDWADVLGVEDTELWRHTVVPLITGGAIMELQLRGAL